MHFTPEDKLILSCIKILPNPEELEQLNELIPLVQDWDYLIATIIDRGIGPLLYQKLPNLSNNALIPTSVKTNLQQVYFKTVGRSTILYEHFRKIAEAFVEQNIPVIGLKGIYLSEWLYQDIGFRQFSDIDLLVKEEDASTCIAILSELGYKKPEASLSEFVLSQFEKDIIHFPAMVFNGVSIELHIKLHSMNEKYNLDVTKLWKNAIPATIHGVNVQALNTTDLLIHLCLHLDKHFKVGHVQFTCFNDVTNVLEKFSDSMDWSEFRESCKLYMCEDIVFEYIVMTHKYMNARVPEEIIQQYSLLLTEEDEQMFVKYLKGIAVDPGIKLSLHFGYLKNVQSLSDRIRYVWNVLFPSRAFMVQKYGDPQPLKGSKSSPLGVRGRFWWLWYPYRWWIGVRGVLFGSPVRTGCSDRSGMFR